MAGKYAILIDGGFIRAKLQKRNNFFPTVGNVQAEVDRIKRAPLVTALALLRVYYYDAPPASGN